MIYYLLLLIRIFDATVFTILAGFEAFVTAEKRYPPWRRWMAASFSILCLGVSVHMGIRIYANVPWTWWSTFSLVAALIACCGLVSSWRSR